MIGLYCVLSVLLALGVLADDEYEVHAFPTFPSLGELTTFVENRCELQNASKAFTEFQKYAYGLNLTECLEENAYTEDQLENSDPNFAIATCKQHSSVMITCLRRWSKLLQPCLYFEEEYLPKFVLDVYEIILGEQCVEIINPTNLACGNVPITDIFVILLSEFKALQHLKNIDYVIRKKDVCSDIRNGKAVLLKNLNQTCSEDTDYIKTTTPADKADKFLALCNKVDS